MLWILLTFGAILLPQWQANAVTNQEIHACINKEMNIDCTGTPNKVVFITAAKFGQYANSECGGNKCCPPDHGQDCQKDVDAVYPGDLDRYRGQCVNKTGCTLQAAPGEVRDCRSPYMADYVTVNYYCGAADGSDLITTTEKITTPSPETTPSVSSSTRGSRSTTTTQAPGGDGGPNVGAIVGGVIIAVLVVAIIVIVVILLRRRKQAAKRGPSNSAPKPNVNGYDNKGLTTDGEWEMEKKQRQLCPVIVEQEVKPRNSNTLARPRRDMPPENSNKPKKRYSSALRQSMGNGDAGSPSRDSTASQNGGTPPSKVGSPTSNGSTNGVIPSKQATSPSSTKGSEPATKDNQSKAKDFTFEEIDLR